MSAFEPEVSCGTTSPGKLAAFFGNAGPASGSNRIAPSTAAGGNDPDCLSKRAKAEAACVKNIFFAPTIDDDVQDQPGAYVQPLRGALYDPVGTASAGAFQTRNWSPGGMRCLEPELAPAQEAAHRGLLQRCAGPPTTLPPQRSLGPTGVQPRSLRSVFTSQVPSSTPAQPPWFVGASVKEVVVKVPPCPASPPSASSGRVRFAGEGRKTEATCPSVLESTSHAASDDGAEGKAVLSGGRPWSQGGGQGTGMSAAATGTPVEKLGPARLIAAYAAQKAKQAARSAGSQLSQRLVELERGSEELSKKLKQTEEELSEKLKQTEAREEELRRRNSQRDVREGQLEQELSGVRQELQQIQEQVKEREERLPPLQAGRSILKRPGRESRKSKAKKKRRISWAEAMVEETSIVPYMDAADVKTLWYSEGYNIDCDRCDRSRPWAQSKSACQMIGAPGRSRFAQWQVVCKDCVATERFKDFGTMQVLRLAAPTESVQLRSKLEGGMREIFHTLQQMSPDEDSLMRMLRAPGVNQADLVASPGKLGNAISPLQLRKAILSKAEQNFLEEVVEPPVRRKTSIGGRAFVKRRPAAAPDTGEGRASAKRRPAAAPRDLAAKKIKLTKICGTAAGRGGRSANHNPRRAVSAGSPGRGRGRIGRSAT